MTKFLLESEDFQVQTAISAEDALDLAERIRFCLILVDIQLPGMDGLEFTKCVRARTSWAQPPIVALTAYAMRGDEQRFLDAGCDGYVSKPIDTRTFCGTVRQYLKFCPDGDRIVAEHSDPDMEQLLIELRHDFLGRARTEAQAMLDSSDAELIGQKNRDTFHRWAGVGDMLRLAGLTQASREADDHCKTLATAAHVRTLLLKISALLNGFEA